MKFQVLVCLVLWRCVAVTLAISYQIEDEEIMDKDNDKEQKRDQTPVVFNEGPRKIQGIQADSLAGNNQADMTPTIAKEVVVKELEDGADVEELPNDVKQNDESEPNDMSDYDKEDINLVKNISSSRQEHKKLVQLGDPVLIHSLNDAEKGGSKEKGNSVGPNSTEINPNEDMVEEKSVPNIAAAAAPQSSEAHNEGVSHNMKSVDENNKVDTAKGKETSVGYFDLPDSNISEADKNLPKSAEKLRGDSDENSLQKLHKLGERMTMFYDHDVKAEKKVDTEAGNLIEKKIDAESTQNEPTIGMKGGQIAGGQITGGQITGGDIYGGVISGGIIDGGTIKGGSVKGGHLTGGLIDGGIMMDGMVEGGFVHNGTIKGGDVKAGNITGGVIAGGIVLGGHVSSGIVKGGVLKRGGVEGGVLLGGIIDGGILKGGVMESGKLLGGIVRDGKITGGTILGGEILGGEVGEGVTIRGGKINGTVTLGRKMTSQPSTSLLAQKQPPMRKLPAQVQSGLPQNVGSSEGSIGGRIPLASPYNPPEHLPDVNQLNTGNDAIVVPSRKPNVIVLSKVSRLGLQDKRDYKPSSYFNRPNSPISSYFNPSYGQQNYINSKTGYLPMDYTIAGYKGNQAAARSDGAVARTVPKPLADPRPQSQSNGIDINQFVKQVSASGQRSKTSSNAEVKPDHHWILNQIKNGKVGGLPGQTLVARGGIRLNRASVGFDGAATFMDGGDYKDTCVSDPNLCPRGVSFEITVKVDPEATNYRDPRYILDTGASSFNSRGLALYTIDNKLRADVAIRDKAYCLAVPLTAGKWQDVVVAYNKDGELNMYINCKLVGTVEDDAQCISCHTPGCHNSDENTRLVLGRSNSEPQASFAKFKAGDLSIYERYLTPQDIDQICGYTKQPAKPSPTSTNYMPTIPRQNSPVANPSMLRTQSGFMKSGISGFQKKVDISKKVPYFSPWGSWSRCSSSCATGTKVRQRSCIYSHAQSGWQTCHGVTFQAKKCSNKCPARRQEILKKSNTLTRPTNIKDPQIETIKPTKENITNIGNNTQPVTRRNKIGKILKKLGHLLGKL